MIVEIDILKYVLHVNIFTCITCFGMLTALPVGCANITPTQHNSSRKLFELI